MKKTIPYLVIIALIAYIIFFKGCEGKQDWELIDTIPTTELKYDLTKAVIEDVPELVKEEIPPEYKWLWHDVDTAKIQGLIKVDSAYIMSLVKVDSLGIVRDWITKRAFARDTIINEVHLIDSIWTQRNWVTAFKTEVVNLKATEHKTTNTLNFQPVPHTFYAGLKLQSNLSTSNVFGVVGWQNGKMLYTGGISLFKVDDNRIYEVGFYRGF